MEKLGEYLDRQMRQKKLDPVELSKRCGLTASYIGRLRKRRFANLTVDTIAKLATALEVNAHEIFTVASGIPVIETRPIDPLAVLDALQKLITDPAGFDLLQEILKLSTDERKRLLARTTAI